MKKVVVTALVGLFVVGGIMVAKGAAKAATPEGKTCVKMAELCGADGPVAKDFDRCVDEVKKAKKLAGEASFEKTSKCIDESSSCAAAAGCWVGGVGVGTVGEALKGLGTALTK